MGLLKKILEAIDDLRIGKETLTKIQQTMYQYRKDRIETETNRLRLIAVNDRLKEKGHTEFSDELRAQIKKLEEKESVLEENLDKSFSAIVATKPDMGHIIALRFYDAKIYEIKVVGMAIDLWRELDKKSEVAHEVAKLLGEL